MVLKNTVRWFLLLLAGGGGGFVRGLRYGMAGGVLAERDLANLPGISSFGHDEGYEVYAVGHTSGELYKLIAR